MLTLQNDSLEFTFPAVHERARFRIEFQRTLRLPDDGRQYPLPPGLGRFPVRHVDAARQVPTEWRTHGGVLTPLYSAEALWIRFSPEGHGPVFPFAVRVAAGKINAVSGAPWSPVFAAGDYVVAPPQPWLDGFAVAKGQIRQFVAAPLGAGLTVEQQLTGREEHGGLQIEVRPLKREVYARLEADWWARRNAWRPARNGRGGVLRSASLHNSNTSSFRSFMSLSDQGGGAAMGLGAGGLMRQQVHRDPYGVGDWDSTSERVFVHLVHAQAWESVTGERPPETPCSVETYALHGLPWFSHYSDGALLGGSPALQQVQTVGQVAAHKGVPFLPSNESVVVSPAAVVPTGPVRTGNW